MIIESQTIPVSKPCVLRKEDWLLACVLSVYSLFWHLQNKMWSVFEWPAFDNATLVRRFLEPEYLLNDFYTNAYVHTPREPFSFFVASLQKMLGLQWWETFFVLKYFVVVSSGSLLYLALVKAKRTPVNWIFRLVFLIGFLWVYNREAIEPFFISGYLPLFIEPTAHTFSLVFFLLGYLISPKYNARVFVRQFLFATSAVIHPVVAVCAWSFFGCFAFLDKKELKSWINDFVGVILGILFIKLYYHTSVNLSPDELLKIYVIDRHPHHFHSSYIWSKEWDRYLISAMALTGFAALSFLKDYKSLRVARFFLLSFILFPLMQFLFVETYPIREAIHFGFTRYNIFTFWMVLFCSANFIPEALNSIPLWHNRILSRPNFLNSKIVMGVLNFAAVVGFVFLSIKVFTFNKNPMFVYPSEYQEILNWLRTNTSREAIVQVDKNAIDPFDVRLFADRAIMGDNGFTFNESKIHEWYERWKAFRVVNDKVEFNHKFKIDYVVLNKEVHINCSKVYENSIFQIYDVRNCNNY